MARTARNAKLDTRSARSKLPARREPYWQVLSKGTAIGYRRGAKGGNWIARLRDDEGKQHYNAIGAADDVRDADGLTVFSFSQAQEIARTWFATKARELAGHAEPQVGPFTVAAAVEEYLAQRERKGSKGVKKDRYAAEVPDRPDARRDRGLQADNSSDSTLARGACGSAKARPHGQIGWQASDRGF